jgi:hypothetical protein
MVHQLFVPRACADIGASRKATPERKMAVQDAHLRRAAREASRGGRSKFKLTRLITLSLPAKGFEIAATAFGDDGKINA